MRRMIGPALLLAFALPGFAEGEAPAPARSPEALEVLKKADAAIKAVDAVRYKVVSTPTGIALNFVPAAEGTAAMVGWNGQIPQKFWAQVKTKKRGTGEPLELTGGGDGESYFLIDHMAKKAYEDMDPNVMGTTGRALQGMLMVEFVHDKPFDDELGAEKVEYQGVETVSGEECAKVHIVYAGGQGQSTWYFAKRDNLPRKRVRYFTIPQQGEGTLEVTLSDLEVAPSFDAAMFKLKLPEGYQRIDDFAP